MAACLIDSNFARAEDIINRTSDWNAAREENLYYLSTSTVGGVLKFGIDSNQKKFYVELDGSATDGIPDRSNLTFLFDARDSIRAAFTRSGTHALTSPISDSLVARWTHLLTADHSVTVTADAAASNSSRLTLTFSLVGTTPAASALGQALQVAGIYGLPKPWTVTGSPSENTGTAPGSFAPGQQSSNRSSNANTATPDLDTPDLVNQIKDTEVAAYGIAVTDWKTYWMTSSKTTDGAPLCMPTVNFNLKNISSKDLSRHSMRIQFLNELAKQVQGERFDFLPTIPPGFSTRVIMTSSAGRVDELPDSCLNTAAPLPDLVVVVKFDVVDPGTGQTEYIVIGQSHVGRRAYVKSLRQFIFR